MVNKKLFSIILATLVTVGIVGAASVAFAQTAVVTTQKTTIVTAAESQPQTFSSLVKALNATNLTATLNDTNKTFTVFAPDNTAFAALGNVTLNDLLTNNTTKLSTILLNHVVMGRQNLTANGSAQNLAGNTLTWNVTRLGAGEVYLGNSSANFTGNAVNTSNGLVQPITGVLTPPAGATGAATAAATAAGGFLGLPGFEAVYGVAGLLAVAYLILRRRQ
jgi:transforming growth factor-beta-induced protein